MSAAGLASLPPEALRHHGIRRVGRTWLVPYFSPVRETIALHIFEDGDNAGRWAQLKQGGGYEWGLSGTRIPPYGLELLNDDRSDRALAWTEGESDTIAAQLAFDTLEPDEFAGFDVLGVAGWSCWRGQWAEYANGYKACYSLCDSDDAGRRLGARIAASIPHVRTVILPDKTECARLGLPDLSDVRGLLAHRDAATLDRYMLDADEVAAMRSEQRHRDDLLWKVFMEASTLDAARAMWSGDVPVDDLDLAPVRHAA